MLYIGIFGNKLFRICNDIKITKTQLFIYISEIFDTFQVTLSFWHAANSLQLAQLHNENVKSLFI